MKIGDLVKYKGWYTGPQKTGLIIDDDGTKGWDTFYYVMWEIADYSWEDCKEIEVVPSP